MNRLSRRCMLLYMLLPATFLVLRATQGQEGAFRLPPPAAGGTRGPSALAFSSDGRTLYVAEQDENRVAIVNADSGKAVAEIPSGGEQPVGIALSSDGRTLVAANMFSGSAGILDVATRKLLARVPLPGMPWGVAISKDGRAFVSVSQRDEVAVVDIASAKITARIPVGHRPRALLLLPDGRTLLCANMSAGSLSLIDTATAKERGRIALPAINLRGLACSSDGARIFVTAQQPHNETATDRPEAMWTNVLCIVRLTPDGGTVERVQPLDAPERGAADPNGIALDAKEANAWIALSGTHEVVTVPVTAGVESTDGKGLRRFPVGTNPRALVPRPNSGEFWIGDHLANSLTVLTADTGGSREIDLGAATPSPNRRLRGRFLFTSAHLTRGQRFSCETCHPDSGAEGLSWKFVHVHDGLDLRNTRDLRGPLLLTGPYGWSGRQQDFEAFVNEEIMGLLRTHKLPHSDVHAFWDLVNETPLPPNPYRKPDGSLTAMGAHGKTLFEGQAGCIACHGGGQHGGAGSTGWIGTTPNGLKLDVPHLVGVYDSAPYLHDGRAATLEEIFTKYNPQHRHGKADVLTADQLHDLLEYVREM